MRNALLITVALLVAGCSATGNETARPTVLTPISPSHSGERPSRPATSTSPGTAMQPPGPDAVVADAVAWVQAAGPVDSADFHVALRGGVSTSIGEDVAFTTPFGAQCMTDVKRSASDLACLVALTDPPKAPPDVYGV